MSIVPSQEAHSTTGFPLQAHEAVVRRAENAFYYAIKKHRDWAMSRLKGNRAGLKDRLLELVTLANSGAVQHLLTDVETWAKWVKNARNAIGHLNPGELEKKIPLKNAPYRLEYVTRAVLHLVILAKLGVGGEVHRWLVFEKWRYSAERFGNAIAEWRAAAKQAATKTTTKKAKATPKATKRPKRAKTTTKKSPMKKATKG